MKYILLFFTVTFTWSFAFSEGHERVSPKVEFNKAVKFVEKKEFLKALNIFEMLANEGFPEAQYNIYHCCTTMAWEPQPVIVWLYIGLGKLI